MKLVWFFSCISRTILARLPCKWPPSTLPNLKMHVYISSNLTQLTQVETVYIAHFWHSQWHRAFNSRIPFPTSVRGRICLVMWFSLFSPTCPVLSIVAGERSGKHQHYSDCPWWANNGKITWTQCGNRCTNRAAGRIQKMSPVHLWVGSSNSNSVCRVNAEFMKKNWSSTNRKKLSHLTLDSIKSDVIARTVSIQTSLALLVVVQYLICWRTRIGIWQSIENDCNHRKHQLHKLPSVYSCI